MDLFVFFIFFICVIDSLVFKVSPDVVDIIIFCGLRCCCDSSAKKGLPCCRRLRRLRRRYHRRRWCFCCAAAVLLLLSHRGPKKIWCCASQCQPFFPFFDTRFVFFSDLMEFRRFAHRKHGQKWCRNETCLFQVRWNYWLNYFYRKHSIYCRVFCVT